MIKRWLAALSLVFMLGLAVPASVGAVDVFKKVDCSGTASESAVCEDKNKGDPITGKDGIILKITNIVAFVAGTIAVIMLIVGGIYYITSGGDPQNIKSAKDTIFNALIGIAVVVMARQLILFVLSRF